MKKEILTQKIINFFKWIWQECTDWKTFVLLLCVVFVMYAPVWGGYLLHAAFWVGVVFCGCFRLFTVLGRPIYAVFSCVHWHNTVYQKSVAAKITKAKLKVLSREFKQ